MTPFKHDAAQLSPYISHLRSFSETNGLWTPGNTLLVGLSGGQDSVAMLLLLATLRETYDLYIHAVHVHHGIRGVEADGDAQFCKDLCAEYNIPLSLNYVNIPEICQRMRLGTQEAARIERHRVLRGAMLEVGASAIALAHTSDDRVETLLFNLLRGSGVAGAVAMQAVSPPIIRPILSLKRAQTMEICNHFGIQPRCDASNLDAHYTRNRIRTELLPGLRAYYNEGVDDALLRFADVLQAEEEVIASLARQSFCQCADLTESRVRLPIPLLRQHPIALQRRMIRLAVEFLAGSLVDVSFSTVDGALRAMRSQKHFGEDLPEHKGATPLRIVVNADSISVVPKVGSAESVPLNVWSITAMVPGTTYLPGGSSIITALAETKDELYSSLIKVISSTQSAYCVAVPKRLVQGALVVRSGLPGDKISCMGMRGTKRVKEILRLAGVLPSLRSAVPIVTTPEGTVLIVGTFAHSADCSPMSSLRNATAEEYVGVVVVPKGL